MRGGRSRALAAAVALLGALAGPPAGAQAPSASGEGGRGTLALRQFLERTGVLRVRRVHPLGRIRLEEGAELRLEALSVHQPGAEHRRALGLAIYLSPGGGASEAGPLYVDLGEVEALLRAMERIRHALEEADEEAPRTEYEIETREGFGVAGVREGGRSTRRVVWNERAIGIGAEAFERLTKTLDEGRRALFAP